MLILQEMTYKEILGAAVKGATAVLPLGSMEQHGPHLPVRTDSCLADAVSEAACSRLDGEAEMVLAPTLWLGASNHHQEFFALSLRERTYIDVLVDTMSSFSRAGFRRLFVLNGHGGNTSPLRVALSEVRATAPPMLIGVAEYWSIAAPAIRGLRTSATGGAAHAGELETSLMLHISPGQVGVADIGSSVPEMPKGFEIDLVDGGPVSLSRSWKSVSESGQIGDGNAASAESGARFFTEIVTAVGDVLRTFHGMAVE